MSITDIVVSILILLCIVGIIYFRDRKESFPTHVIDPEKYEQYGVSFFVMSQVIYKRRIVAICKINTFYFVLYASGIHSNREQQSITSMISLEDAMECYANAIACIARPTFEEVYFYKEKPCV